MNVHEVLVRIVSRKKNVVQRCVLLVIPVSPSAIGDAPRKSMSKQNSTDWERAADTGLSL